MNTKTNTLRAVEEIDDPLEVATREVRQVEAEKAEVKAKLEELRGALAEVDAVVTSGDHRKITDELLERGEKCKRGIAALERALEVVEARRIEANERDSRIRRARLEAEARASVLEDEVKIAAATQAVNDAAEALFKTLEARVLVVEAAERNNANARARGVPVAQAVSGREVLAQIARRTGIYIGTSPAGIGAIVVG